MDDTVSDKRTSEGNMFTWLAGVNTWGDGTHHMFLVTLVCVFLSKQAILSSV